MKYNKKEDNDDEYSEHPCPRGYRKMGMKIKDGEEKKGYHKMDGYKMKGKKHYGPEGWWGI